jgi:Trypsin-co-occurring domain 2
LPWYGEAGVTDDEADGGWVGLAEAVEALRAALEEAIRAGQQRRVRFQIEPVELTMQVGVTRAGKGAAGIKWHVLTLGGERSRETATTQTLKLRLAPVMFDEQGRVLAEAEQLISDQDDQATRTHDDPRPERE